MAVCWPRSRPCDHSAEITAQKVQLRTLDEDLDDMHDRLRRLTARKGMAAKRSNEQESVANGAMLPGESPDDWKARMRKLKKAGKSPVEHQE